MSLWFDMIEDGCNLVRKKVIRKKRKGRKGRRFQGNLSSVAFFWSYYRLYIFGKSDRWITNVTPPGWYSFTYQIKSSTRWKASRGNRQTAPQILRYCGPGMPIGDVRYTTWYKTRICIITQRIGSNLSRLFTRWRFLIQFLKYDWWACIITRLRTQT